MKLSWMSFWIALMRLTSSGFSGWNGSSITLRSPEPCRCAALDAELVHQFGKAERSADHADRADDRILVADDFVGCAGQHVAAGSADILDESQHRNVLFIRQLPDAADRSDAIARASRPGEFIDERHGARMRRFKGALQCPGNRRQHDPRPQRRNHADDAAEPHDRHNGDVAAKAAWHQPGEKLNHAFTWIAGGTPKDLPYHSDR